MIQPQPYSSPRARVLSNIFRIKEKILDSEHSKIHSSGIFESKMCIINVKTTNGLEKYLPKASSRNIGMMQSLN